MLIKENYLLEKQKYKPAVSIISSFESEIKNSHNKEETYKKLSSEFYTLLIKLPFPFQIDLSRKWIKAVNKAGVQDITDKCYNSNGFERGAIAYIEETSKRETDYTTEIKAIKAKIIKEKKEINKLLRSYSFRLGYTLTKLFKNNNFKKYRKYVYH